MEERDSPDHLSSSLTDLMTSLMVIFVLLLLVFLHRTAGKNIVITDAVLKALRNELVPRGLRETDIQIDKKDRNAILVIVPNRLMGFEIGKSDLKPEGDEFLRARIPNVAAVLCSPDYRESIESVIVEGHTDQYAWMGKSQEESQNLNLKLSQDRSMEVVKKTLESLASFPSERSCFLEKLSASGRGEQDLEATPEDSRRVIFKIRVRADRAEQVEHRVAQ